MPGNKLKAGISQRHKDTKMNENEIGKIIVNRAMHLHQALGPGLLESVVCAFSDAAPYND